MRISDLNSKLTTFAFLSFGAIVIAMFIAFTRYAPDAYVMIRYCAIDNVTRSISMQSIKDNNFLFDFITVLGDWFSVSGVQGYLSFTILIYISVFIFKYGLLLKKTTLSRVILIFLISFYTFDLNMLRFNISVIILLYPLILQRNKIGIQYIALSFLCHVLPVAVYFIKKLHYIPIFVILLVLPMLTPESSRLLSYLTYQEASLFKCLLYFIPVLIGYYIYRRCKGKNVIMEVVEAFIVLSLIFLPFNTSMSARCIESGFFLSSLWWVIYSKNKMLGGLLWVFAIASFISRTYGGINAGQNDFIF